MDANLQLMIDKLKIDKHPHISIEDVRFCYECQEEFIKAL